MGGKFVKNYGMKTIALFGGSGKTGKLFMKLALNKGYTVHALVRSPDKLGITHPNLTVIQGDVLNPDDVERVVADADLVVSLFGHVKGSPEWVQTDGTKNIVEAMKTFRVPRIISLSGGGLPYEKDQPKLIDHIIRGIMKVVASAVLNDAVRHASVLKESGLNWMIVRGPRLTDNPAKGQYRVGWVGVNAGTQIARADLADFILKQVESSEFDRKMPFVSY